MSLAFCSAQGHSGTRALRVDEVPVDAGMRVREAIDEAVVDDHAERLGEGVRFAAVVVSATAVLLPCRHLDRLGPRCSGHPLQPSAPAAVTRRRAVAPGRRVGQPDISGGLQNY
ncbi:MAG: hypothetical protein OXG72_11955 [Acidobacteria bacterium]|nr:hypothetical protein [Acidobacteriota bacterium]